MDFSNLGIVAIVVYGLTEVLKKASFIPVNEGQKARIRTVVAILSLVGAGISAWLNGSWNDWISSQDVQVILEAGTVFVITWLGHKTRNGFVTVKKWTVDSMFRQ